jgi:hypothetical protein
MSSKKRTGGRVTPKGTQPTTTSKGHGKPSAPSGLGPKVVPGRVDPLQQRGTSGPAGPTRAGPRGGNR